MTDWCLVIVLFLFWILLGIALCSCTGPRYDAQGNGTRPGDKLERWAIHALNHESYPEK